MLGNVFQIDSAMGAPTNFPKLPNFIIRNYSNFLFPTVDPFLEFDGILNRIYSNIVFNCATLFPLSVFGGHRKDGAAKNAKSPMCGVRGRLWF